MEWREDNLASIDGGHVVTTSTLGSEEWLSGPWTQTLPPGLEFCPSMLGIWERSFTSDFQFWYLQARNRDGRPLLSIPVFATTHAHVEIVLPDGFYSRVFRSVRKVLPAVLPNQALVVGTPMSDDLELGGDAYRLQALELIVAELDHLRRIHDLEMVIFRNLVATPADRALLAASGYARVKGLPNAQLHLPHGTFDEYLAGLDVRKRRNARYKLRHAERAGYDVRTGANPSLAASFFPLFENTYLRSRHKFERPNRALLKNLASRPPDEVQWLSVWEKDRPVGAAYCFLDRGCLAVKRVGFDYDAEIPYLYFILHYELIRLALASGLTRLLLGPTSYAAKREIGATLQGTELYIKHRSPLMTELLALVSEAAHVEQEPPQLSSPHEGRSPEASSRAATMSAEVP